MARRPSSLTAACSAAPSRLRRSNVSSTRNCPINDEIWILDVRFQIGDCSQPDQSENLNLQFEIASVLLAFALRIVALCHRSNSYRLDSTGSLLSSPDRFPS